MPKDTKKVPDPKTNPKTKLWDLAVVFTKLGAIAFGGPAADCDGADRHSRTAHGADEH